MSELFSKDRVKISLREEVDGLIVKGRERVTNQMSEIKVCWEVNQSRKASVCKVRKALTKMWSSNELHQL